MYRILDATAGLRNIWYDRHYPGAVYVDLRSEVKPDIVCDCRQLPFPRGTFDLVVFDPPHHNLGATSHMTARYGHFSGSTIKWIVLGAFHEFARVLKKDGLVLFKWSTHSTKLETILGFIAGEFTPLIGHLVSKNAHRPSLTYWVVLART